MNLYIQIRNGEPFEHPILEENLIEAFPHIDLNDLPSELARFHRIAPPELGIYEVYEGVTYEKDGEIYKDVHHVRIMTDEERAKKDFEIEESRKTRLPLIGVARV